jgi:general secretion pathway protein M
MKKLRAYWSGLQPRERRILGIGGAALVLMLLYALVLDPYTSNVQRLRETVSEQRALLTWMEQAAQEVRQLRGAGSAPASTDGRSLLAITDSSARQAGLGDSVTRVEPDGERSVRVWLDKAAFNDMVRWLDELREQHAVVIDGAVVERSDTPGRVDARVVLKEAG